MSLLGMFPLVDITEMRKMHSPIPFVKEIHEVTFGAMTAGKVTKSIDSALGKGLGEVKGVLIYKSKGTADNKVLGIVAATSSTAGKVDLTLHSSDATETTNHTLVVELIGYLKAVDES